MARGIQKKRAQSRRGGGWLKSLFPERQIIVRTGARGRHFRLGTGLQAFTVCFMLCFTAWSAILLRGYVERSLEVVTRDAENREMQQTYDAALSDMQQNYETALSEMQQTYEAALIEIDGIRTLFAAITREIETSQANLLALAERQAGTRKAERKAANGSEVAALDPAVPDPMVGLERDQAALQQRIASLEQMLSRLRGNNADLLKRSADAAGSRISEVEKMLARTGLDPERLLGRYGRGGPFVPSRQVAHGHVPPPKDVSLASLHAKFSRWEQLEAAIARIPLGTPLRDYEITSMFGSRHDPINQLFGIHEGTDFGAPTGTPAFATGQGKVTHAGWRDRYGMLVEIDHGNGIVTRYGHLSRILVKSGQTIDSGTKIGLVGSTGRSSGPHLHYEVRVDEVPRDPLKFIAAGNNVQSRK